MKKIQIFILSYNRPDYLREGLQSVLCQCAPELFDIIVSDNSTENDVEVLMEKEFSDVAYVRRRPSLPALEHFKTVLHEVNADYFMLYHDDDLMSPDMVRSLYATISDDSSIVAVGCNGWYLKESSGEVFRIMPEGRDQLFRQGAELIRKYLNLQGVAPFSGYLYRTSAYKTPESISSLNKCGKYSDVAFVASGFKSGSIVWLGKQLLYYRLHGSNDAGVINNTDRKLLTDYFVDMGFVKKRSWLLAAYLINDYLSASDHKGFNSFRYVMRRLHVYLIMYIPLRIYRKLCSFIGDKSTMNQIASL